MFFALYRISVDWIGMQFRHVWNLWPLTLLAPYFAIKGLKFLRHVNTARILGILFPGFLVLLVPINVLILYNFVLMYKPVDGVSPPNLDYSTFTNYFVQDPHVAAAYLDTSGLADVTAFRYFAKRHGWENVLFHARRAIQRGMNERESRLMCVRALRSLGKPNEALDVLQKALDDSPEAQLLEINLLMDLRRFNNAEEEIRQLLPEAPPDVRQRLELMLTKISTRPRNN
jgi:tetratricopeptide (TPR) repeat protein